MFRDCNYLGYQVNLLPGSYTKRQLYAFGIQDNDLSSLTVKAGYRVILYNGDDFLYTNRTFTTNVPCLTANSFDNLTTSLRVEAITPGFVTVNTGKEMVTKKLTYERASGKNKLRHSTTNAHIR